MKKHAKLIALLLALALVLSTAACGGGGESSSSSESSAAESSSETSSAAEEGEEAETSETGEAEDGPLTPYEEPITITTAVQATSVQQFIDGDTWEDNIWTRKIKEDLNIDVEVAFSADTSTDAYRNKINALMASGDLPDVWRWGDHTFFKQAYEAGYLADLTDLLDQYATDAVKEYQDKFPGGFEGATIDGRLYAYPYMTDNFHQAINLWIRDDWLENTNSEVPTTIDEMVELARKFTFEDPDGNGADDTYGLGVSGDVLQNNYGTLCGLFAAYGVPGLTSTDGFYRGEDGKVTFAWIQEECKEALTVANQMYEEGLIDPEFVVKDVSNMETDITTGKIGMMYHACWGDWHPFNLSYQDSGVITRGYRIPEAEGHEIQLGIMSNQTGDLFMVNSNCEHPEALVKILNLYEQTCISGSSEDFQTYWANEQYRFCPIVIGIPTELYASDVLAALEAGSPDELGGQALEYYNYVVGFEDGSLADDTNAYGTWGQLNPEGTMAIDLAHQEAGEEVESLMGSEIPDIWVQNSSVLGDMTLQAFTDIITGAQPVEYFDEYVQQWLNAGGQETLDAMEELYPAE